MRWNASVTLAVLLWCRLPSFRTLMRWGVVLRITSFSVWRASRPSSSRKIRHNTWLTTASASQQRTARVILSELVGVNSRLNVMTVVVAVLLRRTTVLYDRHSRESPPSGLGSSNCPPNFVWGLFWDWSKSDEFTEWRRVRPCCRNAAFLYWFQTDRLLTC